MRRHRGKAVAPADAPPLLSLFLQRIYSHGALRCGKIGRLSRPGIGTTLRHEYGYFGGAVPPSGQSLLAAGRARRAGGAFTAGGGGDKYNIAGGRRSARPLREPWWRKAPVQVLVRDNNVDQALRALKKKMQREGVFREMKLRRSYEKPSERRAREKAEAVRRYRKLLRKRMEREGY